MRIVVTSVATRFTLCFITGLKRNFCSETLQYRSEALQYVRSSTRNGNKQRTEYFSEIGSYKGDKVGKVGPM